MHHLMHGQGIWHMSQFIESKFDISRLALRHEMPEDWLDTGRAAKPACQVNIKRLSFDRNLGIELIRVPADSAGSLHRRERFVKTPFANEAERTYEIGYHFDMKRRGRRNPIIASGDVR
jgi:hypothetical protein